MTFGSISVVGSSENLSKYIRLTSASPSCLGQENLSSQSSNMVMFGAALEVGGLVSLLAQEAYSCAR